MIEAQDAEHAVARAVDPLFDHELAAIVGAQRITDGILVHGGAAFALDLELAIPQADQLTAAAQGVGPQSRAEQGLSLIHI